MKKLKNLLKNFKQIEDIIVFGSAVKGKEMPRDIDIAIIINEEWHDLHRQISSELGQENVHIEYIPPNSLLKTRLSLNLLLEGYSMEKGAFLRELAGIKPVKLFVYSLKGFGRSKKALFSMALTKTLGRIKGRRIAPGAAILPIEKSGYFNEFLESWGIKYSTSEWTMF